METTQKPIDSGYVKKMESSKTITVKLDKSKTKVEFKKKGHKEGRMKITLKFDKDESEGFMNFCKLAKPDNMTQDVFAKFLFYKGVQALQQDFAQKVEEFKKNNPEEFAKVQAELDSVTSQAVSEGSVTIATDSQKL
jgi:hypothetical protein